MMYKEYGLTPSKEMAGLMASAIISDTLLFRSPTTTEVDKKILRELAEIAEIDLEAYGEEMFSAGTSLEGVSVTDILMTDSKKFEIEDKNARVSQAFTTNLDSVEKFIDEIITSMTNVNNNEKTDVFALFITDIFNEQSLVITVGKLNEVIANEFGVEYKEKGYLVKDLLSRKKQFIPALTRAVSKIKEEE